MKKTIFIIAVLFFLLMQSNNTYSLNNFNYTGIAFDGSGNIIASASNLTVRIQLIVSGSIQYDETHSNVTTDQFGIYTVDVGSGTVNSGSLAGVSASKNLRIKAMMDNGGAAGVWVLSTVLKPTISLLQNNSGGSGWSLTGNSGTTAGTNFIGTTDDEEVRLEVRNSGTVEQSLRMNTNQALYRESGISGITPGNARGQYAVDLQIYRHLNTQVASGNYSTVGGGSRNTASSIYSTVGGGFINTASGNFSTVGGGQENTASGQHSTISGGLDNTASSLYSTVGGGQENTASGQHSTISGGRENTASSLYSTISGGYDNTASANYSTVGGGYDNTASGYGSTVGGGYINTAIGYVSTVGGGYINTASGYYSTIGGGLQAVADKYAQNAYAGGRFANNGDAQTSLFVVRNETTDATATYLYLDGTSASYSMTLDDQDRWIFRALVVGASDDGSNYGSYIVTGYIYRDVGTVTITGVTTTLVAESSGSYNATAVVNSTALSIQVTGDATNTMRWVARVEVAQLNY